MDSPKAPEKPEVIRVIVVDDHDMVRSGLEAFLMVYDDLELVAEAGGGEQAVMLSEKLRPDVVLMDMVMPDMDGASATRLIRERCPETQIIALTSFKDKHLVQGALQAGAIGYLLKDVSADELAEAIRAAHAGRPTLAPEATQILIQVTTQPAELGHDLTAREQEILACMVKGLNNPEIAEQLVISLSTAKFHVSNVLSKLGATSRTEAVALAVQHGLVDPA
jgi:NarL family two-component system response regulator LiaR